MLAVLAILGAFAEGASTEGAGDIVEYTRDFSLDCTYGAVNQAFARKTEVRELATLEPGDVGSSGLDGAEDAVDSGLSGEAKVRDVDLAYIDCDSSRGRDN